MDKSTFMSGKGLIFVFVIVLSAFAINANAQDTLTSSKKSSYVNILPEYPGGEKAMVKFLSKKIKYPKKARKEKIQGVVVLEFTVDIDGSITNVKAVKEVGDGCTEEAIRVAELMPKWKPGTQNGKVVKVVYHLPITFKLSDD